MGAWVRGVGLGGGGGGQGGWEQGSEACVKNSKIQKFKKKIIFFAGGGGGGRRRFGGGVRVDVNGEVKFL